MIFLKNCLGRRNNQRGTCICMDNIIVLTADAGYLKKITDSETNFFAHHLHPMYFYLAERLNIGASQSETTK